MSCTEYTQLLQSHWMVSNTDDLIPNTSVQGITVFYFLVFSAARRTLTYFRLLLLLFLLPSFFAVFPYWWYYGFSSVLFLSRPSWAIVYFFLSSLPLFKWRGRSTGRETPCGSILSFSPSHLIQTSPSSPMLLPEVFVLMRGGGLQRNTKEGLYFTRI